jgi:formylglycine-generating enzyme required for sulfatase activity
MTGNVWEWTSSAYKSYPYDSGDGREDPMRENVRRVVRGGSWLNSSDGARAAFRSYYDPGSRNFSLGFRVVCVSPIR